MLRRLLLRIAPIIVVIFAAGPSFANEGPNSGKEPADAPRVVERWSAAHELYALGRGDSDPILVIAALRLIAGVPTQDAERQGEEIGGEDSKKDASAGPPDLDTMIATSRDIAGDDPVLNAMIDDVEASKTKGRVRGPGQAQGNVKAGGKVVYEGEGTIFKAGVVAEVALVGDGDTDLDLYIFDELGNEICASTGYADREYCRWTPRWEGLFRIEVRNKGPLWNQYSLTAN